MQEVTTTLGVRQTNRRRIYQYLYNRAVPATKQEIADDLNLSMPTVSGNLSDFLKEGFITYSGTLASTGGRKPRTISLVTDARYAVGISIMDNAARMVAIDMRARELAYKKLQMKFVHRDSYYMELAEETEKFLRDFELEKEQLLGVGFALPGVVDAEKDVLVFAPTLGLRDIPLEEIRRHFTGYPVFMGNDAKASGYAEAYARKETRNLIYLSLERGVGGAILLDKTRYMGDNGRSGEFGHICVVPGGRACRCGRKGCLEAYCSASRLSDDLGITLENFFALLKLGDERTVSIWKEYCHHLTDGLALIRMALDCDIVLGGMLAAYLGERLEEIRRETCEKTLFDTDGEFLYLDSFESHGACIGAALHFVQRFTDNF